jgi:competence protein ComEC
MSDRQTVVLALAVALGAAVSAGPSPWWGAAVVAVAFALRWPWLLWIGGALLASGLGARAWQGLQPGPAASFAGTVTLLSDPEPHDGSIRVEVRAGTRRLEAWARGKPAAALQPRAAGDRVTLTGRARPLPAWAGWLRRRHLVGRLSVSEVSAVARGDAVSRLANAVRTTLTRGTASLPDTQRALFDGLLLGDTRHQTLVQADDFRGAGLTHLLAVSGENLAFVLVLARPLLARLGLRSRFVATLAVIGLFALVTRFEPSVLRASAMGCIAALAACLGREASAVRVLALAVSGLLLVDPLLVGVVGFQLSVAATAGILLLSPRIMAALPGPRSLAAAVAVSLAAQIGVLPVLVPVFGSVPVVAVPANLAAALVTGPVLVWGLPAGLIAGWAGGWLAWLLHRPTALLLWCLSTIASTAARTPLGELGPRHVAAIGVLVMLVRVCRGRPSAVASVARRVAGAGAAATCALPALALQRPPPAEAAPVPGLMVWRPANATAPAVILLDDRVDAEATLTWLRRAGVVRVGAIVIAEPMSRTRLALDALASRYRPPVVLAPPGWFVPGAEPAAVGLTVRIGPLEVVVRQVAPRLAVTVTTGVTPRARGPPGPVDAPTRPRRGPV